MYLSFEWDYVNPYDYEYNGEDFYTKYKITINVSEFSETKVVAEINCTRALVTVAIASYSSRGVDPIPTLIYFIKNKYISLDDLKTIKGSEPYLDKLKKYLLFS